MSLSRALDSAEVQVRNLWLKYYDRLAAENPEAAGRAEPFAAAAVDGMVNEIKMEKQRKKAGKAKGGGGGGQQFANHPAAASPPQQAAGGEAGGGAVPPPPEQLAASSGGSGGGDASSFICQLRFRLSRNHIRDGFLLFLLGLSSS